MAYVGQKMTIFPLCLVRDFLLLAGFAESFLNPAGLREQKIRENKSSRDYRGNLSSFYLRTGRV